MDDCKKCDTNLDAIQLDETPKLMVKGREIGINALDDIINEVRSMDLPSERVADQLLKLVEEKDYVPPSMTNDYREALLKEYQRRFG